MKVDRLVGMIMTLLDKKRISARELADMFEVSPRTIYRDIDAINMAGIPVRSTPGVGGGFEIMPEYKLDKNVFSSADLSAILTGLSNLSGMVRGGEFANALAKIKSLIPPGRARDIEIKANQIRVDFSPWSGNPQIRPYLQRIQSALDACRLLSFEYIAHRGKKTARTVEPCQLVLKSGRWYLYGYCLTRSGCRLFRLSRMLNLEIRQEAFVPRDYPQPVLDFEDIREAMQTEIQLRIHKSVLDRALEFCACDCVLPDGGEHYIVNFPFIENEYHYDMLLSFGDQCECLAPPHVRAEMKRRIQSIAAIYQD